MEHTGGAARTTHGGGEGERGGHGAAGQDGRVFRPLHQTCRTGGMFPGRYMPKTCRTGLGKGAGVCGMPACPVRRNSGGRFRPERPFRARQGFCGRAFSSIMEAAHTVKRKRAMRKHIRLLVMLMVITVWGAALQARAAEISDIHLHDGWAALVLSTGKEDAVRLCTGKDNLLLVLDLYPSSSGKSVGGYRMTLLEPAAGSISTEAKAFFPMTMKGRIHVDGGTVRPARLHYTLEGQVAAARIEMDISRAFLREAEKSSLLRMDIGRDERHFFPVEFSLRGFAAAHRQAMSLVTKVRPRRLGQKEAFGEEEFASLIISRSWEKKARRDLPRNTAR